MSFRDFNYIRFDKVIGIYFVRYFIHNPSWHIPHYFISVDKKFDYTGILISKAGLLTKSTYENNTSFCHTAKFTLTVGSKEKTRTSPLVKPTWVLSWHEALTGYNIHHRTSLQEHKQAITQVYLNVNTLSATVLP